MVLRDKSHCHVNNQLTHQNVLDVSPTLVCLVSVPCRHVPPDNTCCAVSFLHTDCRCCHTQYDPGRCDWCCRLHLISWLVELTCVASSLLLSATRSSGVLLAASSSHAAETIPVTRALVSCIHDNLVPVHNMLSPQITIFGICFFYRAKDKEQSVTHRQKLH